MKSAASGACQGCLEIIKPFVTFDTCFRFFFASRTSNTSFYSAHNSFPTSFGNLLACVWRVGLSALCLKYPVTARHLPKQSIGAASKSLNGIPPTERGMRRTAGKRRQRKTGFRNSSRCIPHPDSTLSASSQEAQWKTRDSERGVRGFARSSTTENEGWR